MFQEPFAFVSYVRRICGACETHGRCMWDGDLSKQCQICIENPNHFAWNVQHIVHHGCSCVKISLGDDSIFQDKPYYYIWCIWREICKENLHTGKNITISPNMNAKCIMHNVVCMINCIIYNALCIEYTATTLCTNANYINLYCKLQWNHSFILQTTLTT